MPDLSEMLKTSGGPFLNAKNTPDKAKGKIVGAGKIEVGEYRGKTQRRLLLPVKIGANQYTYAATPGKIRILAEKFGENSDNWVDKEIVFRHVASSFGLSLTAFPPDHPLAADNIPSPVAYNFIAG